MGLYPIPLIEQAEQVVDVGNARLIGAGGRVDFAQDIHHVVEVLAKGGKVELELLAWIRANHRPVPAPEAFVELEDPQIAFGVRQPDVVPIDESEVVVIVPDDVATGVAVGDAPGVGVVRGARLQMDERAVVRGHQRLVGSQCACELALPRGALASSGLLPQMPPQGVVAELRDALEWCLNLRRALVDAPNQTPKNAGIVLLCQRCVDELTDTDDGGAPTAHPVPAVWRQWRVDECREGLSDGLMPGSTGNHVRLEERVAAAFHEPALLIMVGNHEGLGHEPTGGGSNVSNAEREMLFEMGDKFMHGVVSL